MRRTKEALSGGETGWEIARIAALVILSVLLWCGANNRWSLASLQIPLEYGLNGYDGDWAGLMAVPKSAMDGNFHPFLFKNEPAFGAPFGANWNDFPMVEQWIYFGIGLAARLVGLFAAANLAVLLAQILAALSFYLTCRLLKATWTWAFAGALVYAFSEYVFTRQIHHLQATYYWHVPLCLLVCWWLSEGSLFFRGRRFYAALAIGVVTGLQHPYYTNMFVQLLGLASLVQFCRGNKKAAAVGFAIIGVTMAAFFAACANVFFYKWLHGPNTGALMRNFAWLEFYALKPLDLFMPSPTHRFLPFAEFARTYFKEVLAPGEVLPSCYLGLVGIAALGLLAFQSVRRLLAQPPQVPPLEAWQILWIVLYSIVGGLNCFVGVFGIQLFRSTNRFSIFILTIVLIYAVRHLSRLRWLPPWNFALPLLATVIALWDQIPPPPSDQAVASLARVVDSDRQLVATLEKRLPPGAMIFQIPIMEFPESPAPGVGAYEHMRPFLFSHQLRYSFGSAKGRSDTAWQKQIATLDLDGIVRTLESYGFSAIYVNRSGFPDKGDRLLKGFASLGLTDVIESQRGDIYCVLLHPSAHPDLPPVPSTL